MDWLFGSIKKPARPEVYVSNVVEGDFNVVSSSESVRAPYPLYPNLPPQARPSVSYPPSAAYPSSAAYPLSAAYPTQHPQYSQHHQQYQRPPNVQPHSSATPVQKPVNPLESIPFKISTGLDPQAIPVNEYQLKSIKSQLDSVSDKINSETYNYSFELERSVLRELNYR